MKCYYEVLNVARDANDTDIKSAYRKLALKWHPDKNLDNAEEAKEQFQIVQQAYEVLSDRQERAWYDNHREQILRGSNTEFEDNCLDVFQYFTTSCFKGYDDSEKGFYTVYRSVFEKIAKEDMEFMEDKEEFCEIPSFGNSQSSYEEVVAPFYAYWMSYSTKKTYVWLDPYNINETRERRVLKLIEKENKKVRQRAKKERNEEIRNLVAFVRKRDKRVQIFNKLNEERILENRKRQEEISKQKRLERIKQHESTEQAEWAKFDNVKSQLEQIEKHVAEEFGESGSENELDDDDINSLYCPACNKLFKTLKAFENHESSKKHRENVERLKQEMLDEEYMSISDESEVSDVLEDLSVETEDTEQNNEINQEILDSEENEQSDVQSEPEVKIKNKKKNKKSKNVLNANLNDQEKEISTSVIDSDDDFDFNSSKKQKKKNKKNVKQKGQVDLNEIKIDEEKGEAGKTNGKKKKEKKSKKDDSVLFELDINHCCVTCNSNFPSKNKLFEHLKKTGHGVYIDKKATKQKKGNINEV